MHDSLTRLLFFRSGLGLALKCLSGLELDVHNNWQPSRISIKKTDRALEVSWKDPLAILYLMPLPEDLNMHFGVDICFKSISDRERLIRIVGYDERRYYQRVWHSSRPSSVEVKMTESFSYNETFEEIDDFEDIARVDVWTIVDGHMIAKTSGAIEAGPPNAIPKPPRIHSPKSSQQESMSATVRTDSADREDSNCECHEVEESCDKLDCSRRLQNDLVLTGSESSLSRDSVSDGSKNNRLSTTSSSSPPARRGGGGEFKTTRSLTNILDEGGHQGDPQVHKLMKKSVSQGNKLQQVNNSFKKKTKRSVLRQDDERKDKAGYNNYAFEEDIDAEGTRGDRHILI